MVEDIMAADTLHVVTAADTPQHMAAAAELTSESRYTPALESAAAVALVAAITVAFGTAPGGVFGEAAGGPMAWVPAGDRPPSASFGYVVESIGT
jgi:hypothetical protein